MSALEKIGGTELSTYGLKLTKFVNHVQLPAYKKIMENSDLSAEMRILDEVNIDIELIGKYSSKSIMNTNINNFLTKIKSAIKLVWIFGNHNFEQTCVVKKGVTITPYRDEIAVIRFILNVTSA